MHRLVTWSTSRRRAFAVVLPILAAVGIFGWGSVLTAADQSTAGEVQTLHTIKGGVEAFAADGNRVAWVRDERAAMHVDVLDIPGLRRTVIGRVPKEDGSDRLISFAFGGSDAQLAVLSAGVCGNTECHYVVWRASTRTRKARVVGDGVSEEYPEFLITGGGGMLVYASRGVRRVSGGHDSFVAAASGVTALAATRGRVAVAEDRTRSVDRASPAWSSDGKQIAFARVAHAWFDDRYKLDEDGTGIFVRRAGGGGTEKQVIAGQVGSFDWSSDGRFVFTRPPPANQILVANANGEDQRRLTSGTRPRWSPDGTRIAFARNGGIFVVNGDGSGLMRIASGQAVAWSPDGTRLAIGRDAAISLVTADGLGPVTPLTDDGLGRVHELDWSPDGSRIALSATTYRESDEWEEMAVMSVDGSGRRGLESSDCNFDCRPFTGVRWSPGGKTLVFATSQLYITSVGSPRPIRPLTRPEPVRAAVSIRRAVGGKLLHRLYFDSRVEKLALSPHLVAALVQRGNARVISVHDARTGALRRTVRVPERTRLSIAGITGSRLVFQVGRRTISVLDVQTGRQSRIPTRPFQPFGVSTVGSRVVWAETDRSGNVTYIRALELR